MSEPGDRLLGGMMRGKEGTVWPAPEAVAELDWALRYGEPSRTDLLRAASVCNAYLHLLTYPLGTEHVIATLRVLRRAAKKVSP